MQRLVAEAEQAVLARAEENSFMIAALAREKEFLKDAVYALRAFRTAWEHTEAVEAG